MARKTYSHEEKQSFKKGYWKGFFIGRKKGKKKKSSKKRNYKSSQNLLPYNDVIIIPPDM